MIGILLEGVDWCLVEVVVRLVLFFGWRLIMGAVVVVTMLLLAWALSAALWAARHGDVRPQPVRPDYDSRRPRT